VYITYTRQDPSLPSIEQNAGYRSEGGDGGEPGAGPNGQTGLTGPPGKKGVAHGPALTVVN